MKLFFAVPSYLGIVDAKGRPRNRQFNESLMGTLELAKSRGHEIVLSKYEGSCYVQLARNELIKIFLDTDCEAIVFTDDDLRWEPKDLLRVIETPGDITCAVYRRKQYHEDYPVVIFTNPDDTPAVRADGCILGKDIPAGFMRIKRSVIERLISAHPELEYVNFVDGKEITGFYDLFPQGVHNRRWVGEDFAFCRLVRELGGEILVVPDVTIGHFGFGLWFDGNYHKFLMKQPKPELVK